MNKLTKLALVLITAMALAACQPKQDNTRETTDPVENNDPVVTTPQDTSVCCDARHLDGANGSLLGERVVYFDYDMATIRPEYREMLALHARYLNENPSARMTVEGHADERGSREYNLALGEKRGYAVANLLRAQGAALGQVSVVSYGEERPEATCSNDSCWSKNRRAVLVYTAK